MYTPFAYSDNHNYCLVGQNCARQEIDMYKEFTTSGAYSIKTNFHSTESQSERHRADQHSDFTSTQVDHVKKSKLVDEQKYTKNIIQTMTTLSDQVDTTINVEQFLPYTCPKAQLRATTQLPQLIKWMQRPKFTTFFWEEVGTLCYQVNANNICVSRRQDNDMVNGTKLLNVTGMSRGKRDGILKNDKSRIVVKIGPIHLKGVWNETMITLQHAKELACKYGIAELLNPLLFEDPSVYAEESRAMSFEDYTLNSTNKIVIDQNFLSEEFIPSLNIHSYQPLGELESDLASQQNILQTNASFLETSTIDHAHQILSPFPLSSSNICKSILEQETLSFYKVDEYGGCGDYTAALPYFQNVAPNECLQKLEPQNFSSSPQQCSYLSHKGGMKYSFGSTSDFCTSETKVLLNCSDTMIACSPRLQASLSLCNSDISNGLYTSVNSTYSVQYANGLQQKNNKIKANFFD